MYRSTPDGLLEGVELKHSGAPRLNIAARVSRKRFLSMHPEVTGHKVGTVKFFRRALSQMDAGYKCEGLGKGSIWLRFDTWKVDSNDLKCSMHVGTASN